MTRLVPSWRNHPWSVVGLLWIAFLINYLDRQVVFSIFPALRRDLHFSDTQLALTGTVFTWFYCLSMPFCGRLADILRRDRIIFASLVLWSLATLATGLSNSVIVFLASRAAMGITEALFMPAAVALIASAHTGATRSRALAIFATGQFAGIVLGGWYGGWAADHVGWRFGFYSLTVLGLCYAAALLKLLYDGRSFEHGRNLISTPADVLRSGAWLALAVQFFTFCFMLWILFAWLALFIHDRFALSLADSGLRATAFLQAGSATGTLAGGFLGDAAARRVSGGRLWVATAGLAAATPFAWPVFGQQSSLPAIEFCTAAFGLFGGLFMANLYSGAFDLVAESNYGFTAGALNLTGGLAGGTGVLIAGLLKESVGVAFSMQCAAGSAAVAAGVMAVVLVRRRVRQRTSGSEL